MHGPLGLHGVQIGSHIQLPAAALDLDAPDCPLLEARGRWGPRSWTSLGRWKREHSQVWLPWLVGMPAEQSRSLLPELRRRAGAAAEAEDACPCVEVFPTPSPHRARLQHAAGPGSHDHPGNSRDYINSLTRLLVADPAPCVSLDTVGTNRVMLGTDYPSRWRTGPGAGIAALGLDVAGQTRLYHGTALEWLGLPASRFA